MRPPAWVAAAWKSGRPRRCRRCVGPQRHALPADRVELHVTLLGGGFGRRLEVDYVAQAVRVAMDMPGVPVQLVWSREEDMRHDFYRPMHVARLHGVLGPAGEPVSLQIKSAGD